MLVVRVIRELLKDLYLGGNFLECVEFVFCHQLDLLDGNNLISLQAAGPHDGAKRAPTQCFLALIVHSQL